MFLYVFFKVFLAQEKMSLPVLEGKPNVLGSYMTIRMDPSLADGTSAPNTPERSEKKRDNLLEDTSTSPVKKVQAEVNRPIISHSSLGR